MWRLIIYIKLGWRNVWRNRRRSLVVISSTGTGIFAMIISMAIMNGMNYQMVDNTISTSLGHVSVHKRGFLNNTNASYSFIPGEDLRNGISSISGVAGWAERVKLQGMIRSSEGSQGVLITGIDPEREKTVSEIINYTIKSGGSGFLKDRVSGDILVSVNLAEKLDVVPGDRIVIMFQDRMDQIVGESFIVRGTYRSPIESFDRYVVFTGITKLQRIAQMDGVISEISVRSATRDMAREVKEGVQNLIKDPDVVAMSWQEMAPSIMSAIRLFDSMMYVFFAIIFTTVVFSIANTMIMSVMERFHEIGVMKCIGTRPVNVFVMIVAEAVFLGFSGMTAGLASGILLSLVLGVTGIDLSMFSESMRIWGTGSVIYPLVMLKDIAASIVIVFFTAVVSAIYPALKAARIKPLEALNMI